MKIKRLFPLFLAGVMLSSCGIKDVLGNVVSSSSIPEDLIEPDTTEYKENNKVDLRLPQFRSEEEDPDQTESFVVDKVILHYYNEDGNCNKEGKQGRAFYLWYKGADDGEEFSNEHNYDPSRIEYSSDGTMMTVTIDMINDAMFTPYYGTQSIMYIIKFKRGGPSDLNWGGQSEDVELKFSEFNPVNKVVEVWSTPAAGGGIAQFDSEEKTKVEGIKLAKFTDWKTITCTMSNNTTNVNWELYAFDETYFKVKAKNRAAIKKNYKVSLKIRIYFYLLLILYLI